MKNEQRFTMAFSNTRMLVRGKRRFSFRDPVVRAGGTGLAKGLRNSSAKVYYSAQKHPKATYLLIPEILQY